jgi:hypothetical protein
MTFYIFYIERLRYERLRKVTAAQLSCLHHDCINIAMFPASYDAPCVGYMLKDSGEGAGKVTSASEILKQRCQLQDIPVRQVDLDNPTLSEAIKGPYKDQWLNAIWTELSSLNAIRTYDLVDGSKGNNLMRGHFVLKI